MTTWTGQADARIAELEQQVERLLDVYQTLWHRHHALVRRFEQNLRLTNEARRLPSPHELRTGQTPLGVLRQFNETTE